VCVCVCVCVCVYVCVCVCVCETESTGTDVIRELRGCARQKNRMSEIKAEKETKEAGIKMQAVVRCCRSLSTQPH